MKLLFSLPVLMDVVFSYSLFGGSLINLWTPQNILASGERLTSVSHKYGCHELEFLGDSYLVLLGCTGSGKGVTNIDFFFWVGGGASVYLFLTAGSGRDI